MKELTAKLLCVFILIILTQTRLSAQFSLSAQVRVRGELRDGQGAPLPKGSKPAAFISQRSRLNAGFTGYRLKVGLSLQDVRVWGQDVSQINKNTT
jgi:hypothetical protein